ncbi:AAA domain-containing protein [Halomonas faecis]|uniref:AAA domain-containing protein n=1 Tax=Halomonas faecis TaxID=1562110 RepID=UPI0013D7B0DD|nr:AAA domain-containing protein [Halomonas faecis]
MNALQRITRYFRQSLIDTERLCPADKDVLPFTNPDRPAKPEDAFVALPREVWVLGEIAQPLAERIVESHQRKAGKWLDEVELVLLPRVDLIRAVGGAKDNRQREVLLPLVVFVRLHRDGSLRPSDKAPWVPREWLGPNQGAAAPIADLVAVDAFMTQYPFAGVETWQALVAYCTRLLCWLAGAGQAAPDDDATSMSLFDIAIHDDYACVNLSLLQVETPPVVGAKQKMLTVLDSLVELASPPALYRRYVNATSPTLMANRERGSDTALARRHLAQMTGEFPLSPKQRNALHHVLMQGEGEILAVNGPPGTGKTTLLRSVVANLWTQAALEEAEPPLIVASSNNNQAVTNILESFARIDESGLDSRLAGRWLPEVDSYGLYCCSSGKAKDKKNTYRYLGPRGEGPMSQWQSREFVETAREHFLTLAEAWQGKPTHDVEAVKQVLHQALQDCQHRIAEGIERRDRWQAVDSQVVEAHGDIETLHNALETLTQRQEKEEARITTWREWLDELYDLWEARSLWVRLGSLMPFIGPRLRREEQRKTARRLNRWDLTLEDHSDEAVESWFRERIEAYRESLAKCLKTLADYQALETRYCEAMNALESWIDQHRPDELFAKTPAAQVDEVNDRVWRFQAFKLATHYWEARWLLETDDFLRRNDSDRKSPHKVLRKLRRFAKLTPCFVSTFYMTPSTFMAGEFQDDVWQDMPLFGEIDLLVVDEAGQALPDVSAASFALAKRALVVGDTDQIEPVWSLPASVDRANLHLYDLFEDEAHYAEFWLESGLLASNGNLMRVAQRQCFYHQFPQLQRGLYLTEHRRCFDDIVAYCNALVYQGVLEPLRGKPQETVPWGTLTLVPSEAPSQSYGGSRGNPGQARQIAAWLSAERQALLDYARRQDEKLQQCDDAEVLKKTVGIVTPFSKQAMLIRHELKRHGFEGITVGTVHSLQGDERRLVLFSSVYGLNDRNVGKFYDRGHNMLNVAVSRAKDAFVVFGHPEVFGKESAGSPSGLLRRRLHSDEAMAS